MQRKIPTILGIFLTLVLVGGLAFATSQIQKVTKLFSSADQNLTPREVGVGNITDSSFTAYWITDKQTSGTVSFGKTSDLGMIATTDEGNHYSHFVRVTSLEPNKKYYFKVSGDLETREITTLEKLAGKALEPIFGKVLDSSGTAASDVIVILDKVVALSKNDGSYVLPQSTSVEQNSPETITLVTATEKSVISCQAGLDKPLPTVKLGGNVDCNKQTPTGFKVASPSGQLTTNISEGETVSTPLPTISGRALPNQTVKIEIHSETPFSAIVKADPAGNWSWTPPANLATGQHTVTITITNADGTTQTVTRTFYVSESLPILPVTSGTPSATPPLVVVTPPPVATPTPIVVTPPVTGTVENVILMLTAGVIFVTLGLWMIRL